MCIDDEIPFDIPDDWAWCRLGLLLRARMGKTITKSMMVDEGIPVYSATQSDAILGYVDSCDLLLSENDLVIPARGNSIGYATLIKDKIATCSQTTICCTNIVGILPKYLYYSCYANKESWFKYTGSAIPQITVEQIDSILLALPPLKEQERIIRQIESALSIVNSLITNQ